MRRIVPCVLAVAVLPVLAYAFDNSSDRSPQHSDRLPTAVAEPANAAAYAPPEPMEEDQPSAMDIGPAQRPFVMAADTDNLENDPNAPNVNNMPPEKTALDPKIHVPLVHDVQNDGDLGGRDNHALQFEIKYLNWGAVTLTQQMARRGHYFTITWVNDGPKGDFTARFQYRQVKSQEIVRTLTQPMHHVSGAVRSYFAVVNKAYHSYGPVASWRFTILRGDTVVAQAQSFVW
jgi:hypothetical protein